jgi:hypothetical protein
MSESILAYKNGDKEFKIEIGTSSNPVTYQVIGMIDHEAPDAFKEKRTTKIIDPTVDNTVRPVRFDSMVNMYDTGLHEMSSALMRLYPEDSNRQRALAYLTKNVLNPWGKIRGIKNLEPDSLLFWDDYRHVISLDKVYNTANPEDLASLYQLVLHGKLAPAGLESEPFFRGTAQYAVENKNTVVDAGQKRKLAVSKATNKFITLLDTDKEGLEIILEFMGISGVLGSDEAMLNDIFTDWLAKDDNQNPQEFLELYETYYDSKSGKQEMIMFKSLKDLSRTRKITQTPQGFSLDGEFLGTTLKAASKLVLNNQDLLDKVTQK